MQHEPNPRLAAPETPLVIVIGKVGLVPALEVRHVLPAELHQTSTLQRLERLDHARAAKVHRPKAPAFVTLFEDVLGVGRPAVVERPLCVLGNRPDRRADATWVPFVLGQPLMGVRVEEHPSRLESISAKVVSECATRLHSRPEVVEGCVSHRSLLFMPRGGVRAQPRAPHRAQAPGPRRAEAPGE